MSPFEPRYERLEAALLALNTPGKIIDIFDIDKIKETILGIKTTKTSELVVELEQKVERLEKELKDERAPMKRIDISLFVNLDGSLKYGPFYAEPRRFDPGFGPAQRITQEDFPYWHPNSFRRVYEYAFSQGSIHVYQERG